MNVTASSETQYQTLLAFCIESRDYISKLSKEEQSLAKSIKVVEANLNWFLPKNGSVPILRAFSDLKGHVKELNDRVVQPVAVGTKGILKESIRVFEELETPAKALRKEYKEALMNANAIGNTRVGDQFCSKVQATTKLLKTIRIADVLEKCYNDFPKNPTAMDLRRKINMLNEVNQYMQNKRKYTESNIASSKLRVPLNKAREAFDNVISALSEDMQMAKLKESALTCGKDAYDSDDESDISMESSTDETVLIESSQEESDKAESDNDSKKSDR